MTVESALVAARFGAGGAGGPGAAWSAGLGAPGVSFASDAPVRRLAVEPMDVAAFVGVAPRGPAWEPVVDPTLLDEGVPYARSVPVGVRPAANGGGGSVRGSKTAASSRRESPRRRRRFSSSGGSGAAQARWLAEKTRRRRQHGPLARRHGYHDLGPLAW